MKRFYEDSKHSLDMVKGKLQCKWCDVLRRERKNKAGREQFWYGKKKLGRLVWSLTNPDCYCPPRTRFDHDLDETQAWWAEIRAKRISNSEKSKT